jgi:glutathione S-transferase
MAQLEIIGRPVSNYVWAARIACEEKGVPYKLVIAPAHSPEINAIHPFGKMPVLRHGEVKLCESRAISYYIDHAFDGPPLAPRDPVAGAQTEQWISLVNTTIDPVCVRQYLLGYFFPGTPDGSPNRPQIEGSFAKMETQLGVLDKAVESTGYLVNSSFTLADINLLPILFYLSKMPESGPMLLKNRNLAAYLDRHIARPSVKSTMPEMKA